VSRFTPHLFLLTALVTNAAANVLIKYAMTRGEPLPAGASLISRILAVMSPLFVLGVALFGLNLVFYSMALRTFRISLAYPVMVSGGYCLILIAGWFLFHERLSLVQYGGIALILSGIWLVVR
jgi:multidrug transporter EmrE-like cation transporter